MAVAGRVVAIGLIAVVSVVLVGCGDTDRSGQGSPAAQPLFDPQVSAVEAKLEDIGRGVLKFKEDVGELPGKIEDLLASEAEGWKGPYVGTGAAAAPGSPAYSLEDQVTDTWGNRFLLDATSDPPKLVSLGPDKQEGTEDDIVVSILAPE